MWCCSRGHCCTVHYWPGSTSYSIPYSTPGNKGWASASWINRQQPDLSMIKKPQKKQWLTALAPQSHSSPTSINPFPHSVFSNSCRGRQEKVNRVIITQQEEEGWRSNLGRPVEQTWAATFQEKLFEVRDTTFGESPGVLDATCTKNGKIAGQLWGECYTYKRTRNSSCGAKSPLSVKEEENGHSWRNSP